MKQSMLWLMLTLAGSLCTPPTFADDSTTDDGSVTVASPGETPDQVASRLPDAASDSAGEHAAFGQGVASLAQDRGSMTGRDFGQSVADQVRQDLQTNAHAGAANAGSHGRP